MMEVSIYYLYELINYYDFFIKNKNTLYLEHITKWDVLFLEDFKLMFNHIIGFENIDDKEARDLYETLIYFI